MCWRQQILFVYRRGDSHSIIISSWKTPFCWWSALDLCSRLVRINSQPQSNPNPSPICSTRRTRHSTSSIHCFNVLNWIEQSLGLNCIIFKLDTIQVRESLTWIFSDLDFLLVNLDFILVRLGLYPTWILSDLKILRLGHSPTRSLSNLEFIRPGTFS